MIKKVPCSESVPKRRLLHIPLHPADHHPPTCPGKKQGTCRCLTVPTLQSSCHSPLRPQPPRHPCLCAWRDQRHTGKELVQAVQKRPLLVDIGVGSQQPHFPAAWWRVLRPLLWLSWCGLGWGGRSSCFLLYISIFPKNFPTLFSVNLCPLTSVNIYLCSF